MLGYAPTELGTIESIYDAALEGRLFEVVIDVIAQALPGSAVILFGQDAARTTGNFMLHRGLPPDAIRSYASGLAVRNAWFQRQWRLLPGRIFQDHELLDRETFVNTPFYQEWLSHQGSLECATGIVIQRSGSKQLVLEVRYADEFESALRQRATSYLEDLATHIMRAARIFHLRHDPPMANDRTSDLLDLLSFPMFILNAECRVCSMNAKADALARRMDALFISADGCLHAMEPQLDIELKAMANGLGTTHQNRSERLILPKGDGSERYFATLSTLGGGATRGADPYDVFENSGRRLAVSIQDSSESLRLTHDLLWRTFGLTTAEAELAASLLGGGTIGEYASQKAVSKQTLRNQLVSIMRKTNTGRQPQLVALLTRLAMSTVN